MNSNKTFDSKLWLKTIFSNPLTIDIELARISMFNFNISGLVERTIILVEYAQLISQCILFNHSLYNDPTYSKDTFVRIVVFIAKLCNPGHFLQQENTGTSTVIILTGLICFTLAKLFLLGYMIYIAKTKLKGHSTLIQLWQWVFYLQSKITYFFISSFWINTIFLIKNGSFGVFVLNKNTNIALSGVLIAIEFALAATLQRRYFYALPEKMLLSANSNIHNTISLFQKLLIQILQVALPTNTLGTDWIMIIISSCLSILRSFYFFTKLPLYRIKALVFEGGLIVTVLSMNLAFLMHTTLKSFDSENSVLFLAICWIIVSILTIRISQGYLKKAIINTLMDPSPKFFIHKIMLLKEITKFSQTPTNSNPKNDWYYLLNMTISMNIHKILQSTQEKMHLESLSSELNKLILNHLQYLTDAFPKDNFIKLYLAYFYGIKLKSFASAIRFIKEANLQETNPNDLTLSLLILKIQDISFAINKEQNNQINLNDYVENLALTHRLEENILSQTQTQIELYQQVVSNTPDLAKIFNYAQKIQSLRKGIEKDMDLLAQNTSQANIHPLMLCAEYQLRVNHSFKQHLHFQKLHQRGFQKYSKYFEQDELNEYSAYQQQKTALVILDAQKQDHGRIVYCSQTFQKIYGAKSKLCLETNISSFIPPSLRQTHIQSYGYSQEGYLIPVNILSDIFPIITHSLYEMMLIRPISLSNHHFLLVRENGDIESPTKEIAEKLDLPSPLSSLVNLKSISQELAKINQELVKPFSDEWNIVELRPLSQDPSKPSLSFYSNFKAINSAGLKLISLREVKEAQEEDSGFEIQIKHTEPTKQEDTDWVNLETLHPLKGLRLNSAVSVKDTLAPPTFMGETVQTTEDNFLSPKSNHGLLKENIQTPQFRELNEKVHSVTNSSLSRNSEKQRIEEAFNQALKVKRYSKSWLCLFFLFYLGIATVFAIQLSLKLLLEKDFSNFILKKETLVDAYSRNYLLLGLQITIQIVFTILSGNSEILEGLAGLFLLSAKYQIIQLETVNSNLVTNSNLLERDIQEILFAPNVRLYNSEQQGSVRINTFQATHSVIETTLKITGDIMQGRRALALSEWMILIKNSLNDLLVETENISRVCFESVMSQSEEIHNILNVFLGVILGWVLCMLFSFAFIIRKLYLEEKVNLVAITKLKKSVIRKVLHVLNSFQKKLLDRDIHNHSERKIISRDSLVIKDTGTTNQNRPDSKGISKIYLKYFAWLLVSVMIIAVLAVVNTVTIKNSINDLQEQQKLFLFSYQTKSTAALSYMSITQLLYFNNTSEIKNKKPIDLIQDQILLTQNLRTQGLEALTTSQSSTLTPEIQILVFGDACGLIKDPGTQQFCKTLSNSGKSSGLFQMLITLENFLVDKERRYITSNKSTEALSEIIVDQSDLLIEIFQVLAAECDLFSSFLDQSFQQLLGHAEKNRNFIFGIFTFLLAVQSFFFWVTVLNNLKNANSHLNNVLQVFPSRLVLSNFLLKMHLANASKGLLSLSIKNDL